VRLEEKPVKPVNNIMGTGNILCRNAIFDYIPLTPINEKRKEKELPDLIQCCIDDGKNVKAFQICEEYSNINSKEDLLKAEGYY
jgi:dTDP-glucose pyrophosphorylase